MIRELLQEDELAVSVGILREAFQTVADQLNLTPENNPTNPAFMTYERLNEAKAKGLKFFGLFESERQVGLVALEQAGDGLYYLERLAVLPGYRHRGYGRSLLDFAFQYVKDAGGSAISIGIINENSVLKCWYQGYGFVETGTKTFAHLPFTVCFMKKDV